MIFAGQLDLVPEALDRPLVEGDLGVEELEGDLFADLLVEGAVDDAHPAGAELLDQLEPAGEELPLAQSFRGCFERPGDGDWTAASSLCRTSRNKWYLRDSQNDISGT